MVLSLLSASSLTHSLQLTCVTLLTPLVNLLTATTLATMTAPAEREIMPGVFVTDFRTADTRASTNQAERERKSKEVAEQDDADEADEDAAAAADDAMDTPAASLASAARSSALPVRPANAALPPDIPNDIEELELELAALEKSMAQLHMSTEILREELKEAPEDAVSKEGGERTDVYAACSGVASLRWPMLTMYSAHSLHVACLPVRSDRISSRPCVRMKK